jgi:CAAX prenyl protease-like protein
MLTEAFFNGSPALYPLRVIAGAVVLLYFRRPIVGACRGEASEVAYLGTRPGIIGNLLGGRGRVFDAPVALPGASQSLHPGHPALHTTPAVYLGAWPAVFAGVGVFVLWVALDRLAPTGNRPDPRSTLAGMEGWAFAAWLVFRLIGSVLVVPLAEELAFRGYLLRRLIAADFDAVSPRRFTWASFLISSLLFGLLHGHWIAGTLAGMTYAAVLYRRGRLRDCVLAHAITNGLLAAAALASGDWGFWS